MTTATELAGVALPDPGDHFANVTGVHADSINAGYEAALFSGTTEGRFSPDRDLLRDQMATFLVNLLNVTSDAEGSSG